MTAGEMPPCVVVGGALVGSACALALARAGLEVSLLDERAGETAPPSTELRPIALAAASLFCGLKIPMTTQSILLAICLLATGAGAGFFALPLQVFIQLRPPSDQKGRIIGAMNFITWIGILSAAGVYWFFSVIFPRMGLPISTSFVTLGLLMLVVGLTFRPRKIDPTLE